MPPQEAVLEPTLPTLPPGMPDFGKVSQDYWENEQVKANLAKESSKPAGAAVVTPPSTDAVLDAFTTALDTVVVLPVEWSDDVPSNHPVRSLPINVRLWTGPQWRKFWDLNKVVKKEDQTVDEDASRDQLEQQFWYVVMISACTADGQMLFSAMLPDTEDNFSVEACAAMKAKYGGPAGLLTMNPIYVAGLGFNGLLKGNEERDGKNSGTTNTSTSSGE